MGTAEPANLTEASTGPVGVEGANAGARRPLAPPSSSSAFLALDRAEPLPYKWQARRQDSKLQPAVGPEGGSTGSLVPLVPQHGPLGLDHLLPLGGSPAPRGQSQSRPQRAPPAALLPRYGPVRPVHVHVRGTLGPCSSPGCGGPRQPGSRFCQLEGCSHSLHSPWEGSSDIPPDGAPLAAARGRHWGKGRETGTAPGSMAKVEVAETETHGESREDC